MTNEEKIIPEYQKKIVGLLYKDLNDDGKEVIVDVDTENSSNELIIHFNNTTLYLPIDKISSILVINKLSD